MAKLKTGIGVAGISGTSGSAVFVTRRDGSVILRERPTGPGRTTAAQRKARDTFSRASAAWRALTLPEQVSWLRWAKATDPFAGASGAANAFRSLAVRWFAVNALDGTPPTEPPVSPFGGDAVVVSATGTPDGVRYATDRANAPGVVTELLAIRVVSGLSAPRDRDFRVVGRFVFTGPDESIDVTLKRGGYAVAVRFVLAATGQATDVLRCGFVEVG